jgi:hypothetical protein
MNDWDTSHDFLCSSYVFYFWTRVLTRDFSMHGIPRMSLHAACRFSWTVSSLY